MSFEYLINNKSEFIGKEKYCATKDGAIEFICKNCDFYGEEKEKLECAAFKMLRILLEKEVISTEEIINAIEKGK